MARNNCAATFFILLALASAADSGKGLLDAVKKGDAAQVKAQLEAGGDFQAFDGKGRSALDKALDDARRAQKKEIVSLILEYEKRRIVAGVKIMNVTVQKEKEAFLDATQNGLGALLSGKETSPPAETVFVIVTVSLPNSKFSSYSSDEGIMHSRDTRELDRVLCLIDGAGKRSEPFFQQQLGKSALWVDEGKRFRDDGPTLQSRTTKILYKVAENFGLESNDLRSYVPASVDILRIEQASACNSSFSFANTCRRPIHSPKIQEPPRIPLS